MKRGYDPNNPNMQTEWAHTAHTIHVSNGKYTFIVGPGPTMFIDRGGERWHAQQEAFNALHSIMCELDAARVVVEVARLMGDDAPMEIRDALALHSRLVDDRQKPSAWAVYP